MQQLCYQWLRLAHDNATIDECVQVVMVLQNSVADYYCRSFSHFHFVKNIGVGSHSQGRAMTPLTYEIILF